MEKIEVMIRRAIMLSLFMMIAFSSIFGQVPNGMKYQAVVRDTWGRIIENKTVGVQIKILQNSPEGDAVFVEYHQRTTNEYGLIYLVIGSEDPELFEDIDWSTGPYFIQIGIDIDGGDNYETYGTSELLSVPYALYALHAASADNSNTAACIPFVANVVCDFGALGDGITDNTDAFNMAFAEHNDIFIPSSDEPYQVGELAIPPGKRIWFEQGAIIDVLNTLTGDETEIIAGDYQIFTSTSFVRGTWKSGFAYDSWLGNQTQLSGMSAMVTPADTARWAQQAEISDSVYNASWDGSLEAATKNAIYDKIQSLSLSGGSSFIANVVDDYAAAGDGVTDDAVAFSNALSENNDIFIPYSENNYLISNLVIPTGKRLWFESGAVLDVTNSITGDNTEIVAGDYQLFTNTSSINGSWKSGISFDSWSGNNDQLPGMSAMVTAADTARWAQQAEISDSAYSANWDGNLEGASKNAIYDKIQSLSLTGGSSFIANVVDDYAAAGDGVTDDAVAFSNALSENNDIFIPYSENNYLISNLVIPTGKRLWFESGAVLDVTNSITGDNTEIVAGDYQLFTNTSSINGSWKSGISFDSWSGNNDQLTGMSAMVTAADTARWAQQAEISDSAFSANWDGNLEGASKNAIYDKIQSLSLTGGSSFIANVVDDYAAAGDGVTDDAVAFSNALIENNDIFIPYSENNYLISNLAIPAGKRLWFESGAVLDVTSSITGDSTEIIAGDHELFTSSSFLAGTWKSGIAYDSWSGNNAQIPGMSAMVTAADTARWAQQAEISDSAFSANWDGNLESASKNAIYDKIQSLSLTGGSSFIANVVDDYAAAGDGVTDDAVAFSNALSENNDIFIPYSENNYLISNLVIPTGKRLWFESGAVLDVTSSITGDSTEIIAGDHELFTSSSSLAGTWKSGIAYDSWSGNNAQIPGMSAMVTAADTSRWAQQAEISDSAFNANWDGSLEGASKNAIYDKFQSLSLTGGSAFIANVADDYGAIADGATDNTTAFLNAFNENHEIFIPAGDSTYSITSLSIPPGKRIWFECDAKLDVSGILTGDSTEIIAGDYELFTSSSTLDGTWKSGIAYNSWSGNNDQLPGMSAMVTAADTARWAQQAEISDSAFSSNWDGSLEGASKNAIYDKFQSLSLTGGSAFIANVVDDYGAIGDGATDNTTAFLNAFNENHEIFVPAGDSTYSITSLSIPPGKRIWFECDAKLDVSGTLTGDSTEIIAGDYELFTSSSTLDGIWKGGVAYNSWSGNNTQIPGMSAMVTPADTARWGIDTFGGGSFIANVIDYGAVADGETDNATAFSNALLNNNDIFIPDGDSTYLISNLLILPGKRIWFETGAKLDVTGTLTGDSTEIMAGDQKLFTHTSNIAGTWTSAVSYDTWSGNNAQIPGMSAMVTPADTARWGIDTYGAGSFIANVIDYGASGDGSTNDSAAFSQALAANNAIFIPNTGYYYKISKLTIPSDKQVWFESGAALDITKELIIEGEIIAGMHKIFNPNSSDKIDGSKANVDKAYVEWFGAKNDSSTLCADAFNACLKTFNKAYALGENDTPYLIDDTIHMARYGTLKLGANTKIVNTSNFYGPMLYVTRAPFHIEGGFWEPLKWSDMDNDIYYSGWIWDFSLEWVQNESQRNEDYRLNSTIKDVRIRQRISGVGMPRLGKIGNGVRVRCKEADDKDYFTDVDNLYVGYCDSAIYVNGYEAPNQGMTNSWTWRGLKLDYNIRGLILGDRAWGHYVNGTFQPRNSATTDNTQPYIDVYGQKNVIVGSAWDTWHDSTWMFRESSAHNEMNMLGTDRNYRFVKDLRWEETGYSYNRVDAIWRPALNHYGNLWSKYKFHVGTDSSNIIMGTANNPNITNSSFAFGGYLNAVSPSQGSKHTGSGIKYDNTKLIDFNSTSVTIKSVLKLEPRSSPPSNPTEGMLYVNSSNHHIYCYLAGSWKQLD